MRAQGIVVGETIDDRLPSTAMGTERPGVTLETGDEAFTSSLASATPRSTPTVATSSASSSESDEVEGTAGASSALRRKLSSVHTICENCDGDRVCTRAGRACSEGSRLRSWS